MIGRLRLPSPGVAIGTLALVLTMGGVAYAGKSVGKTVGTAELQEGSVTAPKLHENAVRTKKIASGAVTGAKVDESTLGAVPAAGKALNILSATVNSNGTLARAQQANTSSNRSGAGVYIVDFGGNISACSFVASLGGAGTGPAGEVSTQVATNSAVQVQTFNSNGNAADRVFTLAVIC